MMAMCCQQEACTLDSRFRMHPEGIGTDRSTEWVVQRAVTFLVGGQFQILRGVHICWSDD
jgi:hypothetical protein